MNILVYGDSNSWGYLDDGTGLRAPERWPQVMARTLRSDVCLSEACLPGRTTAIDDTEMGAFVKWTHPFIAYPSLPSADRSRDHYAWYKRF